jgi:hypothetical protein
VSNDPKLQYVVLIAWMGPCEGAERESATDPWEWKQRSGDWRLVADLVKMEKVGVIETLPGNMPT